MENPKSNICWTALVDITITITVSVLDWFGFFNRNDKFRSARKFCQKSAFSESINNDLYYATGEASNVMQQ